MIKKWVLRSILLLSAVIIILLMVSPIYNNHCAYVIEQDIKNVPLPDSTYFVESKSFAGKLIGNGNGMQYLGVVLIKSKQTKEGILLYYQSQLQEYDDVSVQEQSANHIDIILHGNYYFDTDEFSADANSYAFYIVYVWGSNSTIFDELDLRGR